VQNWLKRQPKNFFYRQN